MTQSVAAATASRSPDEVDSRYSWLRLGLSLLLGMAGGVGMWSVVVVLPAVQADFGVARADASMPFTLTMLGFAFGGVFMGRLLDRFGIAGPATIGALALSTGYAAAALAPSLWWFALAQGALIGFGSSATFAPLMADISQWFVKRRGIAVAICASGNYLAGTIWPPIVQHFTATSGWRLTYFGIGLFCLLTMLPLAFTLRRRRVAAADVGGAAAAAAARAARVPFSPAVTQTLLVLAGFACCVAMAMPQVHLVAYCGDLGYGTARGAEMLSLMLACGVVSRITSGWIADQIGALRTLLLGSALQGLALLLYLGFNGLASLYVISALFGLFQGGIVPMYAIIVREYFAPEQAGARVGIVVMATLFGMAAGGWLSGAIFDLTGSYSAAFVHGFAWNLVNVAIVLWLLRGTSQRRREAIA